MNQSQLIGSADMPTNGRDPPHIPCFAWVTVPASPPPSFQMLLIIKNTRSRVFLIISVEMAGSNPRPERCRRVVYMRRSFLFVRCIRFETVKIRTLPILKFRPHSKETYANYPDNMTCPSAHRESSGDTSLLKRKRMRSSLLQNMEKQLLCLCWHFQFDREIYELTIMLGTHTIQTHLSVETFHPRIK